MKTIFLDIETGALPEEELAALLPAFDPTEVKTGNIKDPEKIAAKIAEAEATHRRDFRERAALDPLTGRVVAIGLRYQDNDAFLVIGHDDEALMLRKFWERCQGEMGRVHQLIGFNICQFDLPFLYRRSWKHRVPVPFGYRRGRHWSDQVVDLREGWQLGDRQARGSLDAIAKHLGVGAKVAAPPANGEKEGRMITGADFAGLWHEDRIAAMAYLQNDLDMTVKVARAMEVGWERMKEKVVNGER